VALPVNTVRTVTGKLVKLKRNKKGREKAEREKEGKNNELILHYCITSNLRRTLISCSKKNVKMVHLKFEGMAPSALDVLWFCTDILEQPVSTYTHDGSSMCPRNDVTNLPNCSMSYTSKI